MHEQTEGNRMKTQEMLFDQFCREYPELETARDTGECLIQIFFKEHPQILEQQNLIYRPVDGEDEPKPFVEKSWAIVYYRWLVTKGILTTAEADINISGICDLIEKIREEK